MFCGYYLALRFIKLHPSYIHRKRLFAGFKMPEIRVTVTEELDGLLGEVVERGLFSTKADVARAAIVYFLKDLGWVERPKKK